jgi:hypothetical protein
MLYRRLTQFRSVRLAQTGISAPEDATSTGRPDFCSLSIATGSNRRQVRPCPPCCALRRRAVLLVRTTRNDHQAGIRQRSLQRLRLIPRRTDPHVTLLVRCQHHRHCLGTDRLNGCVAAASRIRAGGRWRSRSASLHRKSDACCHHPIGQRAHRPGNKRTPTISRCCPDFETVRIPLNTPGRRKTAVLLA